MKTSFSLPSLFNESKLFSSQQQLQTARSQFKSRLGPERNQSEERKPSRSLIHFQQNVEGFMSFKTINTTKMDQILHSLKGMKSSTTNLGRAVKAEILFNKKEYAKITDYCSFKKKSQTEQAINRLAKLEPLPMKKEVKKTEKYSKKIKTTVGLRTSLNFEIYEKNRLNWKPFIDFDAMSVTIGPRTYFMGGRKLVPLSYYDRSQDKWVEGQMVESLKTFGQSQGTAISQKEVVFFGGSKFFVMGESDVTNSLTYVNLENKTSSMQVFEQQKVPSRCFHAQCKYGEFLLISGGINRQNKLFNNFMAYHLTKKYWFELAIAKTEEKLLAGFAKHKMMAIIHPRKKYNIYEDEPIIATDSQREQISQEGIYLFGGEDSNVQLSNKLYILKVGMPSIEIYEPKMSGKAPTPRKNFAWQRIREYLFIHGGRNDEMQPWVLGNLCALNLKTMSWLTVKGDKPAMRHSHSLVAYGNEVVVLGGKNMEGLCKEVYPIKFEEVIQYV